MHGEARTLNGSRRSKRSRGPGRGADATTAAVAAGGGGVLAAVGLRQLGEPAGGAQPSAAGRTWAAAGAGLFAGAAGAATAGGRRADCGGGSVGGLGGCMGRAAPIVGGGCGLDAGGSDARAHGPARGGAGLGTLAFTVGLACLTLVLFALGPALGAAKWDLRARMAEHHLTGAARRLVAVEMALATVLALGAGLLGHSFAALTGVNPGFQAAGRMHFWVGLPSGRCHGPDVACFHAEWAAGAVYMNQLEGQLRALPGVTAASATGTVPMDPSNGPPMPHGPENLIQVFPMMVTPGYFDVMGARLMEGRDFNSGDKIGAPRRIIVNQAFVRRFLAGVPPIGRQVAIARCEINNTDPRHRCTIIGVVADLHEDSLALTPQPAAYVSFNQDPTPNLNFVLRSSLPTGTVMAEVERLLPQLPLYEGQH